eukprot:CAMPEP_0115258798 /NCGR_PEP_ID=MMETSP0270-20121206/47486_1 /TAXON_ID=71861 /ORGANISM="Scrippsiella trochoidea, Strain CCMP3099" /LENGTH=66 /DNA_ID=CAMNT_0002674571 /DNA_START=358 /DNA_END=558 /DNA_ORIENTATION=-
MGSEAPPSSTVASASDPSSPVPQRVPDLLIVDGLDFQKYGAEQLVALFRRIPLDVLISAQEGLYND